MSTLKANSYQHVDRGSPSIIINSDGSVSISSTVTYEDVTSVDAVGVITGRSNADLQNRVNVGSGVSIKAGGLNVTAGISTLQAVTATTGTFSDDVTFTGAAANVTWDKSTDDLIFNDNAKAIFGTSSDGLEIFHDSSNSYIKDSGTGGLFIQGSGGGAGITLEDPDGNNFVVCIDEGTGGTVELYKSGTKRLHTTTTGVTVSGDITISDKIIHDGDTNTAIRFPANDTISFETTGSEALRISAAGLVGIGTDNPTRELTIYSPDSGSTYINLTNSTTGTTTGDGFGIGLSGLEEAKLWNYENTAMIFGTNTTERLRITAAGLVGIGSDNPDVKLTVCASSGDSYIRTIGGTNQGLLMSNSAGTLIGAFASGGALGGGVSDIGLRAESGNNILFSHGTTERARIDSSGRLLLGTTTEGHADADDITIETSSGYAGITLRSPVTAGGVIYFSDATSGAAEYDGQIVYSQASNSMVFATNQLPVLTLSNTQNAKFVGIVTATEFVPTTIQTSYKNIIDNGNFRVNQRESQRTGQANVNAVLTADRWKAIISNGGTYTVENTTEGPPLTGLNKAFRFTCTTADNAGENNLANADGYVAMEQRIEGMNAQVLKKGTNAATKISVQFWCKSNLTGTYNVELYDNDNGRRIGSQFTVSASGTWEKKTFTFPGDTTGELDNDNGDSLRFRVFLAAGNNFRTGTNSGSWAANTKNQRAENNVSLSKATSNYFALTGVQVEPGSEPTPFEHVNYVDNLQRCQRQFWSGNTLGAGVWNSATTFFCVWNPTVSMKSKPSVSMKSGGLTNINIESSDLYNITSMALGHVYTMPSYTHNATIVSLGISASWTQSYAGVVCADQGSDRFYMSAEF